MPESSGDLFEIIATARSMRRLKPDPVPPELIRKILEAGTAAPSGGNMRGRKRKAAERRIQGGRGDWPRFRGEDPGEAVRGGAQRAAVRRDRAPLSLSLIHTARR
jgi:nitroreductase